MDGYVTLTRVRAGRVRTISLERARPLEELLPQPVACATTRRAGTPLALRERWTWIREELGMMTFYLLDAESWR